MRLGICSFSFHRTVAEGKMDIFSFITTSRDLGCTQLDPWNAHLSLAASGEDTLYAGRNPNDSTRLEPPRDAAFLSKIKATAADAGLPFGCIAVDGAHIYEADADKRKENRRRAYEWLDIAADLGAEQVRVDAGGPAEMPADVFEIIVEGYNDIISRANQHGIRVLVENHWGPTTNPDNVLKLLDSVDGLGFLFDTNNWIKERQREAWDKCAARAESLHIKTFQFDANGDEATVDLKPAFDLLKAAGYDGSWGVESVPKEVDELEGARLTIAMIRRMTE
jgi:sugar phosphate isomerase/epimerase